MKKTRIYVLITLTIMLLLVGPLISSASLSASVTLTSSGTISSGGGTSGSACTISISGSTVTVTSGTGSTIYSGASVDTAWDDAFTYVASGGTITVDPGTYTATLQNPSTGIYAGLYGDCYSGFITAYMKNVNINFQSGAILTMSTSGTMDAIWSLWYCNNVKITGMTLNGNAPNEACNTHVGSVGIMIYDSNNTVVTDSTIYNCRTYGFTDGSNYKDVSVPCGITDCTIYDCYWNGICFDDTRISGDYAIGNTVYNCSDVGISTWGASVVILNNYIYGINGTDGWDGVGTGSHYGIALEGGSQCLVENNTIRNCPSIGICDGDAAGTQYSNLIIDNSISGSAQGIDIWTDGYDTVTQNTILNWSPAGGDAIDVLGYETWLSPNTIISYNTIGSPKGSAGTAYGIEVTGASNCSICDNTMTIPTSDTYVYGIYFATFESVGANYNLIEGNNVQAHYGIYVAGSGCTDNKINGNTLSNCTTQITNDGTSTIINPTSSSTYTLTLNDPYSSVSVTPAQGTHVYSSGAQTSVTLSPTSGYTLNVDGSNVTLTSGTYTVNMNQDNFAYVISTTGISGL